MSGRRIDRQELRAFVDGRRSDGWLVSVAVEPEDGPRRYLALDVPLRGVIAELNDHSSSMMVLIGDTVPHATHFVQRPISLAVEETADGAARTVIAFRSPMQPELVDVVAPANQWTPRGMRASIGLPLSVRVPPLPTSSDGSRKDTN